jgi:uncharacterized membrane protein YbhN (UPF0104 family)
VGLVVLAAVVVGAGIAVYHEHRSFEASIARIGGWPVAAGFAAGLVGVGSTMPVWLSLLRSLGVRLPFPAGARVFFTSQLGKYLPGSVWPVVMQMEMGRSHGASRRTMLGANVLMTSLGCGVGLILACILLPAYDAEALTRYWWGLLALPGLLAVLHPRALPALVDRVMVALHRPPMGWHIAVRDELRTVGWWLLSWGALGTQVWVLCTAVGHGGFSTFLVSTGGVALAVPLGILFIPAPAGAGVRDVVLALVLTTVLTPGQALAVVVASRAVSVACDLTLAGLSAIIGRRSPISA